MATPGPPSRRSCSAAPGPSSDGSSGSTGKESRPWPGTSPAGTFAAVPDGWPSSSTWLEEAARALAVVQEWTASAGLTLHPNKTRIIDAREDAFEFLGYRIERRKPGLTHHFSLGFLGFSWKIQDIHMMSREYKCAVLVTTLSESRKTVRQKFEFVRDTKLPI
jgi:hypothetical protein